MTRTTVALSVLALLALAIGCAAPGDAGTHAKTAPYTSNERGLDRRNMDESVDPCDDFYQYANGKWLERNPIPAEHSIWSISNEMRERNTELLRDILEQAAASGAKKGSNKQKVGDFWTTGMDVEAIEKAKAKPLAPWLERIDKLESAEDVRKLVADLHLAGVNVAFSYGIFPDLKDSERYLLYAIQGGLGLPDRDYYLREDDESQKLRDDYAAHIARMFKLLGDSKKDAEAAAAAIMGLETKLAEASLTRVEMRNPENYYNPQKVAACDEQTPKFSWSAYFDQLGLGEMESISFPHVKFFTEMNAQLDKAPMSTWKSYFRWHLVTSAAPYLSEDFVDEDFDFYSRRLQGTEEQRPRWKRVTLQVSADMGEAMGQLYVERAFPPKTKARADEMIENLRATVKDRIGKLEWMTDETRKKALKKLAAFNSKIGYPDEWRDYSSLEIGRESYVQNVLAANAFEVRRNLKKIGGPIDRNEWGMAPQVINAYYNPTMNEIVFPAAIMQPPFFDGEMDDARELRSDGRPSSATSSCTASTTRAASSTPTATWSTGGPTRTESSSRRAPPSWSTSTTPTSRSTTCTSTAS